MISMLQGGHSTGKPGKVRELKSGEGKVRENELLQLFSCRDYCSDNRAVKCRLIWHFRGQALLLRVLHVVAFDNVRDCGFLKDDLNRVK